MIVAVALDSPLTDALFGGRPVLIKAKMPNFCPACGNEWPVARLTICDVVIECLPDRCKCGWFPKEVEVTL